MSGEDVEMVRRGYEAFNRGDFKGMVEDIAPAFEFIPTGALPDMADTYRGPEGWQRFSTWLSDQFDAARVEPQEILDADEKVLAEVVISGRGKQSGVEARWNVWHVWTLRNGKVVHGQAFTSRDQALQAAGLRE
jgi:ketosteroid isomerase-like protein